MQTMVFVRTRTINESGDIRANLANTKLKRGSTQRRYSHKLSVVENHLVSARCWIIDKMPLVNSQPVGCQSYTDGYIYAFACD